MSGLIFANLNKKAFNISKVGRKRMYSVDNKVMLIVFASVGIVDIIMITDKLLQKE